MSEQKFTIEIDGKPVNVQKGDTILEAINKNGLYIPTLCYLEGLSNYGGCRLCLVEIKGSSKLFPACTTPAERNMKIITRSETLEEYRRMLIQLMLSERTHVCSVCMANGSCELQDLATDLGVDHTEVNREWTIIKVDSSHERFVLDSNRCILCMRCVRICDEIEGVHVFDVKMRGKESRITLDLDEPWKSASSCTSCGKCSAVCPVGAIYVKNEPISNTRNKELPCFIKQRRQ